MHFTEFRADSVTNSGTESQPMTGAAPNVRPAGPSAFTGGGVQAESASSASVHRSTGSGMQPPPLPQSGQSGAAAAPGWFQQRKVAAAERQAREQLAASVTEEDEQLSIGQRIVLWFVGFAAMGYGISLVFHAALLAALSIVLVQGMTGDDAYSTFVTESDDEVTEFDSLDTRLDPPGGESQPEVAAIQMDVMEALQQEPSSVVVPPQQPNIPEEPSEGDGDLTGDDDGVGGRGLFRMPKAGKAITKGSFTAWTIPEDPVPRKPYLIVIQIRLPDNTRRYRASDLSGMVQGTDGYTQRIPWDPRNRESSRIPISEDRTRVLKNARGYLPIRDSVAQLVIAVQAADALVKDQITIRSRRLDEQQTINIEF